MEVSVNSNESVYFANVGKVSMTALIINGDL